MCIVIVIVLYLYVYCICIVIVIVFVLQLKVLCAVCVFYCFRNFVCCASFECGVLFCVLSYCCTTATGYKPICSQNK
jgi:hypothetical protein